MEDRYYLDPELPSRVANVARCDICGRISDALAVFALMRISDIQRLSPMPKGTVSGLIVMFLIVSSYLAGAGILGSIGPTGMPKSASSSFFLSNSNSYICCARSWHSVTSSRLSNV